MHLCEYPAGSGLQRSGDPGILRMDREGLRPRADCGVRLAESVSRAGWLSALELAASDLI